VPSIPTIVLAHGAGAGQAHPWMRHLASGLEARGCRVVTFDFPYMAEGRKLPDKAPVLEAAFEKAWLDAAADATGPMFAAGKSMGGRMASMVASRQAFLPAPAGLIFFGYPLHPPNRPDKRRGEHLPDITTPMLFVHGTKDPFGTPDEMKTLVDALPTATLNLVDKGDHSLMTRRGQPVSAQVMDQVVAWLNAQ
jgi:uncharacterized protein